MYSLFSVLIVLACIFLVLIVLVQNSKGGGLASNFSSSNQVMGVRRTTDFLEKATWSLASGLIVFCILASVSIPKPEERQESKISTQIEQVENRGAIPEFPTTPPPAEEELPE